MRKFLMGFALADRINRLSELAKMYKQTTDPDEIAAIQLVRFNTHWQNAWQNIPFYQEWRGKHKLPEQIENLNQLANFPILTKQVISDERDLVARSPGNERSTLTGGTSGVSTPFPMGKEDANASWVNTHLGRGWNGISPGDRLFMIWGHSHLFGDNGVRIKQFKRQFKDRLNNIYRVSAYNLDDKQMAVIARAILRFKPRYIIGYGSCLARFCDFAEERNLSMLPAKITRVVNTSETLDIADATRISKVFGCPVINEYGMAEAGVIGYSKASLYPISVFWHDLIVRTSNSRLLLTTLGERCFPLINYDTEDLCGDENPATGSILFLTSLLGKARDIFEMVDKDGIKHEVSVVLFDHILKQISSLRSLHYELAEEGTVLISYTSDGDQLDHQNLKQQFVQGMGKEGIEINGGMIEFSQVSEPLQTAAGKRKTLVRNR